jgi:uncharacterized FlaG/YvyC family protein
MDKILELSDKIDATININDKIKLIKELNEMIEVEKNNLNFLLNNDIKNLKIKILPKYKKMTINELEEAYETTNNINDKVSIYLAIDKYYTNIEEELFD